MKRTTALIVASVALAAIVAIPLVAVAAPDGPPAGTADQFGSEYAANDSPWGHHMQWDDRMGEYHSGGFRPGGFDHPMFHGQPPAMRDFDLRRPGRNALRGLRLVAEAADVDPRDIVDALIDGETVGDFLEARGIDVGEVADEFETRANRRIDEALDAGRLTSEQADRLREHIGDRIDRALSFAMPAERTVRWDVCTHGWASFSR